MNNSTRQEQIKSSITLDKLSASPWQKEGTITAQIRQHVTTKSFYPSKKTDSDMQANIFANQEFGFSEQEFVSKEARVAFILVPVASKEEEIKAKLEAAYKAGACIYRVLSNEPIIDENQQNGIKQGLTTKDVFANAQALRFPVNEETVKDGTANKLILDGKGNVQYRRTFLWLSPMEDKDMRDASKTYLSAELKAELAGAAVLEGQTV